MHGRFSAAVEAIYAAAARPSSWPIALQGVADCFGDVGSLLIYKRENGSFGTIVSPHLEKCVQAYEREWWKHDIRTIRAIEYGYRENAGAITDRHFATDEEIETHPIYTQFLAPFGLRWVAGVHVAPQQGVEVGLSVQRAPSKLPFTDDELDVLTALGRHVEQALRLSLRLIDAELVGLGLGDALSRLSVGAFIVDDVGTIVFANRKAEDLLGIAFVAQDGKLTCRSTAKRKEFSAKLRSATALQSPKGSSTASHQAPLIIGKEAGHPLAVHVLPLCNETGVDSGLSGDRRNIILAIDFVPGQPLDPSLVRDIYGLTLGESKVASLVGMGVSPQETAVRLNVAESTIRSALKRVFAKVGVSRQAELTALLSQLLMADRVAGAVVDRVGIR